MKKITTILIILLISAAGAFSDEAFFPTRRGMVQLTANLNASGRVEGYNRMTVRNVSTSGSNITVTYGIQVLDRNRRSVGNTGEKEYRVNISDGTLIYRLENMMDPFFAAQGMNYTMTAGTLQIPSNLAQGRRLENTWMKINVTVPVIGTVTADTAITNQICTGIETVTVPAGTFEAYKITQTSTTKTTGWPSPTIINTGAAWYVRGIGIVKSITYDARGRVESSSELHELLN